MDRYKIPTPVTSVQSDGKNAQDTNVIWSARPDHVIETEQTGKNARVIIVIKTRPKVKVLVLGFFKANEKKQIKLFVVYKSITTFECLWKNPSV